MTREEAIELLDNLTGMVEDNQNSDYDTALKMAIKVLEQEPCEDAVSRKAVDLLCFEFLRANSDYNCAFYERFLDLPAVTPTHKASEWQQDHAILKAHSDGANEVIDRIKEAREKISDWDVNKLMDGCSEPFRLGVTRGLDIASVILDKLIAEVEGKNERA